MKNCLAFDPSEFVLVYIVFPASLRNLLIE